MYNQLGCKTKARRPTRRTPMDTSWKAGLEDVIAARSAVCAIDGAAGRLFYRGYENGELAGRLPLGGGTPPPLGGRRAPAAAAGGFPPPPRGPPRRPPRVRAALRRAPPRRPP